MTATTTTKLPPLHLLRGILRKLKVPATAVRGESTQKSAAATSPMQTFVLSQYRAFQQAETATTAMSPLAKRNDLQKVAMDYYALRQALAERTRLHELDAGAEVQLSAKEMSRRAAARAGLQLPDLNPELEQDWNNKK